MAIITKVLGIGWESWERPDYKLKQI